MRRRRLAATVLATALCLASAVHADAVASGRVLRVGPGETFTVPSQAAAVARDGDTVDIDAGTYAGDVAVWRASHLTLRGVGGRAVLDARGHAAQGKAIWVIAGNDTTVQNITFTGAAAPDHNGAGIRQEGTGLTVMECVFRDNEDGLLAGDAPTSAVTVENSEFDHNGYGDGYSHNIYIGHVRTFTLRGCYSHNANVGHDVKSRALTNDILYNRVSDDNASNSSYLLDLPNGGDCRVIGNVFRRGPHASSGTLLSFAEEGPSNPRQALFIVNNTFADDETRHAVTFIRCAGRPTERVINNLFLGAGIWTSDTAGVLSHNLAATPADFVNAAASDFRLAPHSAAIGAGIAPGQEGGFDLTPHFEYAAPEALAPRPQHTPPDVGAYEWNGSRSR